MRREADRVELERDRVREENKRLRMEMQEWRSRLGEDLGKINANMEDPIARNFGIMNDFFLTLNDEITDEKLFYHGDSKQEYFFKNCEISPFEGRFVKDLSKPANFQNCEEAHRRDMCSPDFFDYEEDEILKDSFREVRPKSVGTIPKNTRILSSNISDPCLLSSVPHATPEALGSGDQSTIDSEMNSLDSGIIEHPALNRTTQNCQYTRLENSPGVEKIPLFIEQLKGHQEERIFVKKTGELTEEESGFLSLLNSNGQKMSSRSHNISPDYEGLQTEFDQQGNELKSLKNAHGKLQKVLSEKGSELSHAVRKAEAYERETKKLRYKLEEIRKQQRYDRQAVRSGHNKIKLTKSNKISKSKEDELNINFKIRSSSPLPEDIYDQVEEEKRSSLSENTADNIYDTPNEEKVEISNLSVDIKTMNSANSIKDSGPDNVTPAQQLSEESHGESNTMYSEPVNSSETVNIKEKKDKTDEDPSNAMYASVDMEMKKIARQKRESIKETPMNLVEDMYDQVEDTMNITCMKEESRELFENMSMSPKWQFKDEFNKYDVSVIENIIESQENSVIIIENSSIPSQIISTFDNFLIAKVKEETTEEEAIEPALAIYASVNMDRKKNEKKQRKTSN